MEVLGWVHNAFIELDDVTSLLIWWEAAIVTVRSTETWVWARGLIDKHWSCIDPISHDLGTTSSVDEILTSGPTSHVEVACSVWHRWVKLSFTAQPVCPSKWNTPAMSPHSSLDSELRRSLEDHAHQKECKGLKTLVQHSLACSPSQRLGWLSRVFGMHWS
jgi:hypothetical protein